MDTTLHLLSIWIITLFILLKVRIKQPKATRATRVEHNNGSGDVGSIMRSVRISSREQSVKLSV